MESTQTYLQIVAGVATILFLVSAAMSYRTWRWHSIVLAVAVFCAGGFYFYSAVTLLYAQKVWREEFNRRTDELVKLKEKNEHLEFGVEVKGQVVKLGVEQLKQKVREQLVDRPRIWVNCRPGAMDLGTNEIKVEVPEPSPHQIKKGLNLFVFDERGYLGQLLVTGVAGEAGPADEGPAAGAAPAADAKEAAPDAKAAAPDAKAAAPDGKAAAPDAKGAAPAAKAAAPDGKAAVPDAKGAAPAAGTAKAAAPKDKEPKDKEKDKEPAAAKSPAPAEGAKGISNVITLLPAWPYMPRELQRLKNSQGPWALYEKMPVDGHEVFVDVDKDPIDGLPLIDPATGKLMTRTSRLGQLLPASSVDEYIRDLQPVDDKDLQKADQKILDRVAVKVAFIKAYEPPGQNVAPEKKHNFSPGDEAWLLRRTVKNMAGVELPGADDLAKQGVVKLIPGAKPRYERALRDYSVWFAACYDERQDMAVKIEELTQQIASNKAVYDNILVLQKSKDEEYARLSRDSNHYQLENKAIDAHLAALRAQYKDAWSRMVQLFAENQALAKQLDEYQRRAAAAINRRAPASPEAVLRPPAGRVPAGS